MVNRYGGDCEVCGAYVPASGGTLHRVGRVWVVRHLACADGQARVVTIRTSGGEFYRNAAGRCEDAPCCG